MSILIVSMALIYFQELAHQSAEGTVSDKLTSMIEELLLEHSLKICLWKLMGMNDISCLYVGRHGCKRVCRKYQESPFADLSGSTF